MEIRPHSPFKADVYFVNTRLFTGNKWGTANPIMLRDADFGIVRARAYGTFDFHVTDVKLFLKEVAGTDDHFRLDEFSDTMRSRIVSVFTEALAAAKLPVLDVAARYMELGEALLPFINPAVTPNTASRFPVSLSKTFPFHRKWNKPSISAAAWLPWATSTTMSNSKWPNP